LGYISLAECVGVSYVMGPESYRIRRNTAI